MLQYKSTTEKSMAKFSMDKYITYYCGMLHMGEIPRDIIIVILSMMISTDEIHSRLQIMEMISSIFNINIKNLEIPLESDLTDKEIYEIIIFKLFYITTNNLLYVPFQCNSWKIVFRGTSIRQFNSIMYNCDQKCICCSDVPTKLCNNIPICANCHIRSQSVVAEGKIERWVESLLGIDCLFDSELITYNVRKELKKLSSSIRYDSLKFGFVSDEQKKLIFIPKSVYSEEKLMKNILKKKMQKLNAQIENQLQTIQSQLKLELLFLDNNHVFYSKKFIHIINNKIKKLCDNITFINKTSYTPLFPIFIQSPTRYNHYKEKVTRLTHIYNENKKELHKMHHIAIEIRKNIITKSEAHEELKELDANKKCININIKKKVEKNAQKHVNNKIIKTHRITQPCSRQHSYKK